MRLLTWRSDLGSRWLCEETAGAHLACICAVARHELVVCSLFDDATVLEHHDAVGGHDRADALGDYKVILDRNPFGLRPPPPPPKIETPPPPETPTNYKLTGITALFKPTRVMFVNQVPGKPPEYLSLSEGQLQGSIEVLPGGIDVKAGTVKVKISGEERTMSFEKDGLKMAAAPQPMSGDGASA